MTDPHLLQSIALAVLAVAFAIMFSCNKLDDVVPSWRPVFFNVALGGFLACAAGALVAAAIS